MNVPARPLLFKGNAVLLQSIRTLFRHLSSLNRLNRPGSGDYTHDRDGWQKDSTVDRILESVRDIAFKAERYRRGRCLADTDLTIVRPLPLAGKGVFDWPAAARSKASTSGLASTAALSGRMNRF
jgi:hypothetical protein